MQVYTKVMAILPTSIGRRNLYARVWKSIFNLLSHKNNILSSEKSFYSHFFIYMLEYNILLADILLKQHCIHHPSDLGKERCALIIN